MEADSPLRLHPRARAGEHVHVSTEHVGVVGVHERRVEHLLEVDVVHLRPSSHLSKTHPVAEVTSKHVHFLEEVLIEALEEIVKVEVSWLESSTAC